MLHNNIHDGQKKVDLLSIVIITFFFKEFTWPLKPTIISEETQLQDYKDQITELTRQKVDKQRIIEEKNSVINALVIS